MAVESGGGGGGVSPLLAQVPAIDNYELNANDHDTAMRPVVARIASRRGHDVHIVQATNADRLLLTRWVRDVARRTEPIDVAAGINADDHWAEAEVALWLSNGAVFIGLDDRCVCGLVAAAPMLVDAAARHRPPLDLGIDLTADVAVSPHRTAAAALVDVVDTTLKSMVSSSVPDDCSRLLHIELLCVHPSYQGCGLGQTLWRIMLKHADSLGHSHVSSLTTATRSTRIAIKFGMRCVFVAPYASFRVAARPALGLRAYDGCEAISVSNF